MTTFARPRPAARSLTAGTAGLIACALAAAGCDDGPRPAPYGDDVYGLAGGCFAIDAAAPGQTSGRLLQRVDDGARFAFVGRDLDSAARLYLEPADLGVYLLRDADGRYLVASADGSLGRAAHLESDVTRNEDGFVSPALWAAQAGAAPGRFQLRDQATGRYLATDGVTGDSARAAGIALYPTTGCAPSPELTLDAVGPAKRTRFADGALFGFVDAHEHMMSHLAFGAGGVFHGAPFHPLGVEHALGSCEPFHGTDGRRDMVGYFYGGAPFTPQSAAGVLLRGDIGEFYHHTDGYPDFRDWPRSWGSATHQTMYYRWLQRAWLGGLRLMVQHATSNQVLCEMTQGVGTQEPRISCNEMVSADRIIDATRALERYIDAHEGGPGKGWLRVVETPAEARRVIGEGRLAVILGIETSTLFDCFVNPRPGYPQCDAATIRGKLDAYHARGVRALFPVHKFDNAFSAGDGNRGFIEIGNVCSSGYYGNFTNVDCPDVPSVFDHGPVNFGGMNLPRAAYNAPPPIDTSKLSTAPIAVLGPFLGKLSEPALPGDHCQSAGMQPLGETLLIEMMRRGMIIEVDHMPRRTYKRAYELLHKYNYPAAGTHGNDNRGDLYRLGGISTTGLPRCQSADVAAGFRARIASIAAQGGYPAQGFGFDFNGFAGGPRPRFGESARCSGPQTGGVTYPFTAYGGDVVFQRPQLGHRAVDFDNEGMIHIGLLPELIQDARGMGMSDADLEPLFRSAEGYLRMWERAEAQAKTIP